MKCPGCNYVSHDYLDTCRSCGNDLSAFKTEIGLRVQPPGGVLDLSEAAAGGTQPAAPEFTSAPSASGIETGPPEAMPTLEFVEIEDEEPGGGTGP